MRLRLYKRRKSQKSSVFIILTEDVVQMSVDDLSQKFEREVNICFDEAWGKTETLRSIEESRSSDFECVGAFDEDIIRTFRFPLVFNFS